MDPPKKYVGDKTLSGIYDVAIQTWRNWRFQGTGPPYVKAGRAVLYSLDEVGKFFESRKVKPREKK